jgi:hypothetical protein
MKTSDGLWTRTLLISLIVGISSRAELLWIERPGELPYAEHIPPVKLSTINLIDARQFFKCEVFKETYATISFRHSKGISKVDKYLLTPELKKLFPINADGAKIEAEANAAGRKATADKIKLQEAKAELKSAQTAKNTPVMPPSASATIKPASLPDITRAVETAAQRYYGDGRKNGSGQTMVFGLTIDLDEPHAVPGWTNRYEVKGESHYNYYDSIWGGSFTSSRGSFTAQVEQSPSGGLKVVDFTAGF